jgi:hypothetical protein
MYRLGLLTLRSLCLHPYLCAEQGCYERHGIGTGQIDWSDELKRESLRKNLLYLAKASQYLMIKGAERVRTFDMGQVPEKLKEGRPHANHGVEEDGFAEVGDQPVGHVDGKASDDTPRDFAAVDGAGVV